MQSGQGAARTDQVQKKRTRAHALARTRTCTRALTPSAKSASRALPRMRWERGVAKGPSKKGEYNQGPTVMRMEAVA